MLEYVIELYEGELYEGEPEYPVACRSLEDGITVLFLSEQRGVVIKTSPDSEMRFGEILNDWTPCSDPTIWEPVNILITN